MTLSWRLVTGLTLLTVAAGLIVYDWAVEYVVNNNDDTISYEFLRIASWKIGFLIACTFVVGMGAGHFFLPQHVTVWAAPPPGAKGSIPPPPEAAP